MDQTRAESPEPKIDRLILQLWQDYDQGELKPLSQYVAEHPEVASEIAREHLAIAETHSPRIDGQIAHYRLLAEIGRGGQAVVWMAEDTKLDRKVALKIIRDFGPDRHHLLERFQREASITSRLEHPGICPIYETGFHGDLPWISMRYVEGETLANWIARTSGRKTGRDPHECEAGPDRRTLLETVRIVESTARSLHAAHEAGIIHRDIKPGNIMLTEDMEPVVLDFGLAAEEDRGGPSLTMTGDLLGTPAYMSPEQIASKRIPLDRRTDVYSLSVVLYEMLSSRRPFQAISREALFQMILSKEPEDLRRLNRDLPRDIRVVCESGLRKDRDHRYETALDLAEDLRRFREGEPVMARKVGILGRAWRWSCREPIMAALSMTLIVVLLAMSALIASHVSNAREVNEATERNRINQAESQLASASLRLASGDRRGAIAVLQTVIDSEACLYEATATKALLLVRLGESDRALATLKRHASALSATFAEQLIQQQVRAEAQNALISDLPDFDTLTPDAPIDHFLLAVTAVDSLRSKSHRWKSINPSLARYALRHATIAILKSRRGRLNFLTLRADAAAASNDAAAARETAHALMHNWPSNLAALKIAGFALLNAGTKEDLEESRRHLIKAREMEPNDPNVHYILGCVEATLRKPTEAIRSLRRTVALDSDHAAAHEQLGRCLWTLDRHEEALNAVERAVASAPLSPRYIVTKGRFLSVLGRNQEAYDALSKAVALNPKHIEAHFNRSIVLSQLGNDVEALRSASIATSLAPKDGQIIGHYGTLCIKYGDRDKGIALLRRSVDIDPTSVSTWNDLGYALLKAGRVEEAEFTYQNAVKTDASHVLSLLGLGRARQALGRVNDAISTFRRAIAVAPQNARAHRLLGSALRRSEEHEKAVNCYKSALRIDPSYIAAHVDLGCAFDDVGLLELAMRSHNRAIEMDARNEAALMNCGFTLIKLGSYRKATASLRLAESGASSPESRKRLTALLRQFRSRAEREEEISRHLLEMDNIQGIKRGELLDFARVALQDNLLFMSSALYERALTSSPPLQVTREDLRRGIQAQLRAGIELKLPSKSQSRSHRMTALAWLRKDLETLRKWKEENRISRRRLKWEVERWISWPLFEALIDLPADEDRQWNKAQAALKTLAESLE